MKTNVCLTATLRQPFRSLLLLILFGLITFGFMTKAVEFILIQRETEVLGSYYRSIGVLENIADPQSGDISAGIDLIETSPYFAYGDQREIVSGVMSEIYSLNYGISNFTGIENLLPEEQLPNVHMTDVWFTGKLIEKDELMTQVENGETIGYILKFSVDTVLAAYPEYTKAGNLLGLIFLFKDHEAAIPLIDQMEDGQRYFIRGWEDYGAGIPASLVTTQGATLVIKPLDDGQLWYIPLEEGESIDFSGPGLAPIKNEIDILNENLHTLGIIATADMSAIPEMQEAARFFYLTEGRWLNHHDDVGGKKVIVVPEDFAARRNLELGDELQFTFRPLTDTYFGLIRDGVDSQNWKSYPTHQDAFKIVGIYAQTNRSAVYAFIPTHSLPPGFTSVSQAQFRWAEFSFVLDSTRHEAEFVQSFQGPLEELGIRLTFLETNGPAYWASVDPIRRSLSADLLVFGGLLVVALILAVFLYQRQRRRDYAILRALGVPAKRANSQLVRPLFLLGGIGIAAGGLTAWNYALDQARETLSTIPTPAGVSPSADLSPIFLLGLCAAIFLLLTLLSLVSAFSLARKPVFELLQGESAKIAARLKPEKTRTESPSLPLISSSLATPIDVDKVDRREPQPAAERAKSKIRRKYTPASLGRYVLQHALRSRLKSFLTLAIALGFVLAAGWIRQTMERSRLEVDRLFDTTVVEADILPVGSSAGSIGAGAGTGFVYRKTVQSIMDSGFVQSSVLEADTTWFKIERVDTDEEFTGRIQVYAYDSAEAFSTGLGNPDSLIFAPDWDLDRFAGPRTFEKIQNEGVPALFPDSLLEGLEIEIGKRIRIAGPGYTYLCLVVGQYSGQLASSSTTVRALNPAGNYILIPLSVLETIEGGQTKYTVAHFSLDPAKNRELAQFREDMEEVMDVYAGSARLVVWDEELRIVINQLEQNISLLEVLYPVVIVVSTLVGAGLCYLLLLQLTREAAILRVLGTTQTAVRLGLISEPVILSLIGVAISLGIGSFLWTRSGLVPLGSLLASAGLYLAGALAGAVAGAISVTNKKPLELLQVKE